MGAAELMDILRTEYGIENEQQFEEAVKKSRGLNIGIFTVPLTGRSDEGGQEKKEAIA